MNFTQVRASKKFKFILNHNKMLDKTKKYVILKNLLKTHNR